jgi:hypothetical protein
MTVDYTVHITFYEEETERLLSSVDHAQVPRVGDRVWLHSWVEREGEDAERDFACWEVQQVVWHYTDPASMNGLNGKMGGIVDIITTRSQGVFK